MLAAKSDARSYGELSAEAFGEQATIVSRIEATLVRFTGHEKINYLMLMMVDPHVHFHVVPRYEGSRSFDDADYPDAGWPGMPALSTAPMLDEGTIGRMIARLRECGLV